MVIAFASILLLFLLGSGDGRPLDRAAVLAINAAFARLPFVRVQRELLDQDLAEMVLVAGLVLAWNADGVGVFARDVVRRRVVLAVASLLPTYLLSRTIQHLGHSPRPLEVLPLRPLTDAKIWAILHANYRSSGSFPSDHAALAAIAAVMAFSLAPKPGWFFAAFGAYASLDRIATGFHWASDVAGGVILGTAVACAALALEPRALAALERVVDLFRRYPARATTAAFLFFCEFGAGFSRVEAALRDLGLGRLFH